MQASDASSDQPDESLIREVLSGNRNAYAHLVRRYERQVHVAAWAVLRNHQAAEDVTQETFIKAYDKLATLRTGSSFGPWLLTIVRHTAAESVRNKKRLVFVAMVPDQPAFDEQAENALDEEDAATILSALARIPDQEQQVILLRYFDNLAVADIAAFLGCPVGTVTKNISRALSRLRDRLKEKL